MKKSISAVVFLAGIYSQAQLQNPGFEQSTDYLPSGWMVKPAALYEIKTDSSVKNSGVNSLQIKGENSDKGSFQPFSQVVAIPGTGLRKIEISAYIKSENAAAEIALWAQLRNSENKMTDFGNSVSQNRNIEPNTDWKRYSLEFTADDDADNFLLGGYLSGNGKVWFDDFAVTEIPFSQKPACKTASKYINEFKNLLKKHSVFRKNIDWDEAENNLKKVSLGMETVDDTAPALQYMMKLLNDAGDSHSFIESKKTVEQKNTGNPAAKEPESKLLSQNIGYIKVPGFSSVNKEVGNSFAYRIQQMIRKIDTENTVRGWVVDLRTNTGGNMYPMIAGLGPLTGEGTLGYFTDGKKKEAWKYKNGKTYHTEVPEPYYLKNADLKIAVLIGPNTASSGEATAISFIGKANVKTFGNPSAGLTSANRGFKLSDGRMLLLASSYEMDRTGKSYTGKIQPDIITEPSKDPTVDAATDAAIKWILK